MSEKKQHRWAKEIHAWADSETIQYQSVDGKWKDVDTLNSMPNWDSTYIQFRIKPEIEYPVTRMTNDEMYKSLPIRFFNVDNITGLRIFANEIIKRAIDDGQVSIVEKK